MSRSILEQLRLRIAESQTSHEQIFTSIYRSNSWGNSESVSGPGSTRARGACFAPDLIALLARLEARTLLDVPCGDFNWIGAVAESVEAYIGVDVVRDLIARNRARHGSPSRKFIVADLTTDDLPRSDVVLCRDCLVHFSDADVWRALTNIRRSGSTFLITTTFADREENRAIRTGDWRPINLEAAPFLLPAPIARVNERCLHSGGIFKDKELALWALESLPIR